MKNFQGLCLTFNCETNGYCGGDAGHGSNTTIIITNHNGDAYFKVNETEINADESVKLNFKGDWELQDLINGLKQITEYLENNLTGENNNERN